MRLLNEENIYEPRWILGLLGNRNLSAKPNPIQLHVDLEVDSSTEQEMVRIFRNIFRPAIAVANAFPLSLLGRLPPEPPELLRISVGHRGIRLPQFDIAIHFADESVAQESAVVLAAPLHPLETTTSIEVDRCTYAVSIGYLPCPF